MVYLLWKKLCTSDVKVQVSVISCCLLCPANHLLCRVNSVSIFYYWRKINKLSTRAAPDIKNYVLDVRFVKIQDLMYTLSPPRLSIRLIFLSSNAKSLYVFIHHNLYYSKGQNVADQWRGFLRPLN